ncbi:MAG: hypothetical protein IK016_09195 [Lachnospiraceae bacterium]|nr:hypothetical protein [Lachnospiraceae bacterium]
MKKTLVAIMLLLLGGLTLLSCSAKEEYHASLQELPNSGEIEFGEITLTIPEGYIRDSTMEGTKEGTARRWEQGNYQKIVTISKHERYEIDAVRLEAVKEGQGRISSTGEVEIRMIDFMGGKAIESRFPVEVGEMAYLIFNTDEAGYDFSVQGDTTDYEAIRDSIVF